MEKHSHQKQDGDSYKENPFGQGTKLCRCTSLKPLPEEGKDGQHTKPNQHITAAGQHNTHSGSRQSNPAQRTLLVGKPDNCSNRDQVRGEILGVVKTGKSAFGTGEIAKHISLNSGNTQGHEIGRAS